MRRITFVMALAGIAILSACKKDPSVNPGMGRLEVSLTDSPAEYQQVNIDIQRVEVHTSHGDTNSGWIALDINEGVYNLLELTNGIDTVLGSVELPAGKVSQLRFILGNNNSIMVDNQTHKLETPSSMQSGLKLQIHADIKEGITYKLLLDFDAARSIVATGSGKYNLKPVIKVITEATSGAIKGVISPASSKPVIYAINGTDTSTTYADTTTGYFLLRGLAPATYSVMVKPAAPYKDTTFSSTVTKGIVTDVDTIVVKQ
jgi:hypothetical protein